MSSVNVRAIDEIAALSDEFRIFARAAVGHLAALEAENRRILAAMEVEQRRRTEEVRRWRREHENASAAYRACLRSGGGDGPPDCSEPAARLAKAANALSQAEAALAEVDRLLGHLRELVLHYVNESRHFSDALSTKIPHATAMLDLCVINLERYRRQGIGQYGNAGTRPNPISSLLRNASAAASDSAGYLDPRIDDPPADLMEVPVPEIRVHVEGTWHLSPTTVATLERLRDDVLPSLKAGATVETLSEPAKLIYDAFYGGRPVLLRRDGDGYEVIDGYDRVVTARHLGMDSIPARVLPDNP